MLENDIIEATSSEWALPIVMVKKMHGSLRMCVDFSVSYKCLPHAMH